MAIQWTVVCTQDVAPPVLSTGALDCSAGTAQVVPYQYLSADGQAFGALLNLSASDASLIGFAMMSVWAIAWGIKMAILTLGSLRNDETE